MFVSVLQGLLLTVARWAIPQAVVESVCLTLVDAGFRLLDGVVLKTPNKVDDAWLADFERRTDKVALAKRLAAFIKGRLPDVEAAVAAKKAK